MIDWFRGQIPFLHTPLPSGRVLSLDIDGVVDWESVKAMRVRSSFETSISIRSYGSERIKADGSPVATHLQIDGNPARFLQGHNVLGSEDLNHLVLLLFRECVEQNLHYFGEHSDPLLTEAKIKRGDYAVNMIDVNRMFELFNDASVESWLHAAEMKARTRSGRAARDKGTVYLQKNSRRWAFKFYNKFRELSKRGKELPEQLHDSGLREWTEGKLRAELRLHSLELKKLGILKGSDIPPQKVAEIYNAYAGKIEMNTQATLIDSQLLEIPRACSSTYHLWRQGVSTKDMLPRNTFYRHRRMLLEFGIDITCPPSEPDMANVIPLMRVLEAQPCEVPIWVLEKGLIK
jgi:II/X family phage/plasmid replication protein